MARPTLVLVVLAVSVACGGSPVQPTTPPAPTPGPVEALVARMTVQVDSPGLREAIAGFSEVSVDASTSTGPGPLTFLIDFGDGSTLTTASGKHVYATSGTFTVRADVRDSQGRVASRTQSVVVKRFTGSWFHASYNAARQQVEIRRLEVQSQDGRMIRGVYLQTGAADEPFVGTLNAPRDVQITAGSTTLKGTIPNELNAESEPWQLEVGGGGYNGERLNFRAVIGEPASPAPDASLQLRMDSFGSRVAIAALTEIDFDGSGSRGDGLSYFIDFDDGQFAAAPRAFHVVDPVVPYTNVYTARMTVVDRFGRANTESVPYAVFRLPNPAISEMWYFSGPSDWLSFTFDRRSGVRYEGSIYYRYPDGVFRRASCTAMLSGERDIRIVVESLGLEFRGYIDMSTSVYNPGGFSSISPPVVLTQQGGPHDGRTWKLKYDDGPG